MKSIGTFEAKTHLSRLLSDVEHHKKEFSIQRRGLPIAVLLPYATYQQSLHETKKKEILEGFRHIREQVKKNVSTREIKTWILEGRKR